MINLTLVSYANENMYVSLRKLSESYCIYTAAPWNIHTYGYNPISTAPYIEYGFGEFEEFNKGIFSQKRGAGYWLWKPYLIFKTLINLPDNEILIYSDAGVEFVNNPQHIVDAMQQDIFLFGNNYKHVEWCKGDCMMAINGRILPSDLLQVQASVIFIRNNETTRNFVKEWLLWCQMPGFIDDSPSKLPNYPTFAEHRHDQAILTCLAYKYGYQLHYWPAQYNNGAFKYEKLPQYANDNYPIIFHHHRKRNNEW